MTGPCEVWACSQLVCSDSTIAFLTTPIAPGIGCAAADLGLAPGSRGTSSETPGQSQEVRIDKVRCEVRLLSYMIRLLSALIHLFADLRPSAASCHHLRSHPFVPALQPQSDSVPLPATTLLFQALVGVQVVHPVSHPTAGSHRWCCMVMAMAVD